MAYADVRTAFQYYLAHYNGGHPIIIAAHSEGSRYAVPLLKEFFDGQPLQHQLVAAYLVGWPIRIDTYATIPLCTSPQQTGCFVFWHSFLHGFVPRKYVRGQHIACINPLRWTTDPELVPAQWNKGIVLRSFDKLWPGIADAQVHEGATVGAQAAFRRQHFSAKAQLPYCRLQLTITLMYEQMPCNAQPPFWLHGI